MSGSTGSVSQLSQEQTDCIQALEAENASLKQRLEKQEEYLATLEAIVSSVIRK